MAKVKFGAIVTDCRNKLGSQVFSKNRYGAYTRSYKSSLTSNTSYQATVRSRLATFSTNWKSLTQTQRDAWNLAVYSFLQTDIFGSTIRPSGFDLYVKLNFNLNQIGLSPLTLPPLPGTVLNVGSLSIVADGSTPLVSVTFDNSMLSSDYTILLLTTACISPGINYVKNLVRTIASFPGDSSSTQDVTTAYIAKFFTVGGSNRISACVVTVNNLKYRVLNLL